MGLGIRTLLPAFCLVACLAAGDPVSVDVRDEDIRKLLQFLADKGRINLIVSPKVRGTITLRVTDMEPRELIFFIARTNGMIIEDHGRILAVYADLPPAQNVRYEIIPLQNAKAEEVAKMIESLKIDKRTRVTHDERTNRLIVVHEE